ncbi:MAG: hypothetical protein JJE36_01510 [Coriobacteriia bacterium]|nr:hypothetical protein [Coriobacteriia bacterium]
MKRKKTFSFLIAAAILALLFVVVYSVRDIVPENQQKDDLLGVARSAEATQSDAASSVASAEASSSAASDSSKSTGFMTTLEESDITSATLSSGDGFSTWIAQPTTVTLQTPSWATTTTYRLDDGNDSNYVTPIAFNSEGKHSLYYQSTSDRQVETLQAQEVWIDFTPPSMPGKVVFSEPASDGFSCAFGESTDAVSGIKSYEVTVTPEGDETAATFSKEFDGPNGVVTGLKAGRYVLGITAVDFAGNRSTTQTMPVAVGLPAPILTCKFDDSNVANDVALGKWITSDAGVRMIVSIESSAPAVTLKNTTLAGSLETTEATQTSYGAIPLAFIDEGSGKVVISATDMYGNDSIETSFTLNIDHTPPSRVSIVKASVEPAVSDSSQKNLKISWQSSGDAVSGVKGYHIRIVRKDSGFSGTREIFVMGANYTATDVEDGTYAVTVTAEDNAGLIGTGVTVQSSFGRNDVAENSSGASAGASASSTKKDSSSDSSGGGASASSTKKDSSSGASAGASASSTKKDSISDSFGVGTSASSTKNESSSDSSGGGASASAKASAGIAGRIATTTQAMMKAMWDALPQSLTKDWRLWIIGALGFLLAVSLMTYYFVSKHRFARKEKPQPVSSSVSA